MGMLDWLRKQSSAAPSSDPDAETVAVTVVDLDALRRSSELVSKASRLAASGSHSEALTTFDLALAQNPTNADALAGKAAVLIMTRRFDEALRCCDTALSASKEHGGAWFNRGLALANGFGRSSDALDCFDRAAGLGITAAAAAAKQLRSKLA